MSGFRRVVFDTGTLVSSALRADSVPYRALMHAFGSADLCASGDTLAKLDRVLKWKKFNRHLDQDLCLAFAAMVRRNARLFEEREDETLAVQPECRDANDNKLLSSASVAGVEVTVSSDEDLLVLHPWCGISINAIPLGGTLKETVPLTSKRNC